MREKNSISGLFYSETDKDADISGKSTRTTRIWERHVICLESFVEMKIMNKINLLIEL